MYARRDRDPVFEEHARRAFAFLSERSVPRVARSDFDASAFGNALVELIGDRFRVRITRDRSEILVDLAPLGTDEWFDEEVVLRVVGAAADAQALVDGKSNGIDSAAAAVSRSQNEIAARFAATNWATTRAELSALQKRRAAELFGLPLDL